MDSNRGGGTSERREETINSVAFKGYDEDDLTRLEGQGRGYHDVNM